MQYIDNLFLSRLLEKSENFMWSGKWPPCIYCVHILVLGNSSSSSKSHIDTRHITKLQISETSLSASKCVFSPYLNCPIDTSGCRIEHGVSSIVAVRLLESPLPNLDCEVTEFEITLWPASGVRSVWHCRSDPSRGPWKVTLDRDIYQPIIEHCRHRPTRWNIWQAFNNRASYSQDEMNLSNHKIADSIRRRRYFYTTDHLFW